MGFIYHTATVVTSWEADHAFRAWQIAQDLELRPTGVCGPYTNGYMSFLIPPDGSKEGWETSDEYDSRRDDWVRAVVAAGLYLEWVEVRYGEAPPKIVRSHDTYDDCDGEEPNEARESLLASDHTPQAPGPAADDT